VKIQTVLGTVSPTDLGTTSVCEHLICDAYWVTGYVDHLLNDERLTVEELLIYADAGGRTLVELSSKGLRRNPEALKRISEASGVQVIMGCGWYRQKHYPPDLERRPTNDLAQEMIRDLTIGVADTGIRAGIIGEIGTSLDYITPGEERVLRAAARAHKRTGTAIYVSSEFHPVGVAQLEILREEGADLRRVVVGHADSYLDPSYHEAILRSRAFIACDGVGKTHIYPDGRRVDMIKGLIDRGYADQLVLGSSTSRRSELHAYGGNGYDYLLQRFLPMLRQDGIGDEQIRLLTVVNPARVLAG
jgi:predicted metal-dependent phosphotriesterase family hydrolase